MTHRASIDVVIPTWNGSNELSTCLEALAAEPTPHSVIVVDNGSSDGTQELVRERFPAVQLLDLGENLGFGKAVNRGVAAGNADSVILLNNDAYVQPGFLDAISAPLVEPGVGMVAGVLLVKATDVIDSAGVEIDRGLAGYSFMAGFSIDRLDNPPAGLLGPSGGAAAFRRVAYEEAQGFDEELFAYSEDVDLALRVRGAGWSCAFAPTARADHVGSATLGLRNVKQVSIASRSRGYMLGRWRVGAFWVATEFAIGLADCLLLRSRAPLAQRIGGFRIGRRMSARSPAPELLSSAMGWRASQRRRLNVVRSYERRRAR